jgi:uncharacterized protein YidB (DUF937 family)
MGLLDDLLRQVGGGPGAGAQGQTGGAGLFSMLNDALSGHGGVQGLVNVFQQGGLGDVVSSWIGTGSNLPISAEQLQEVLGRQGLSELAAKLGVSGKDAAARLAEALPTLVDGATPGGTLPAGGDLLGKALDFLKK